MLAVGYDGIRTNLRKIGYLPIHKESSSSDTAS